LQQVASLIWHFNLLNAPGANELFILAEPPFPSCHHHLQSQLNQLAQSVVTTQQYAGPAELASLAGSKKNK
jgi:hypothetical protein